MLLNTWFRFNRHFETSVNICRNNLNCTSSVCCQRYILKCVMFRKLVLILGVFMLYCIHIFFMAALTIFMDYLMTLSVARLWNIKMVGQLMNWRNLEGRGCGLIKVLCWHLPGGTEENKEEAPFRGSLCPGQDSDKAPVQLISGESLGMALAYPQLRVYNSWLLLVSNFLMTWFLCFWAHVLATWWPSHASLVQWPLASADSSQDKLTTQNWLLL
jgi:hypothetical protein